MLEVSIYNQADKKRFSEALREKISPVNPIFMCIGTEKVFSDSLGPRVGSLLNEIMNRPAFIYGLKDQNITAENLCGSYSFIKAMHPDSKVIVIDAGVGANEQLGNIQLSDGGIIPGAATNKNLPMMGDVSIVGIVAEKGLSDFYTLNSTKDKLVNAVAEFIAEAIADFSGESA